MRYTQYLIIIAMCLGYQHSFSFVFLKAKFPTEQTPPPPPPPPSAVEVALKAENEALTIEKQKSDGQVVALTTELVASRGLVNVKENEIITNRAKISSLDIQIREQAKALDASKLENDKRQKEIKDLHALNLVGLTREKAATAQITSLTSELANQKALVEIKDKEIKTQATKVTEQVKAFEVFKITSQKSEADLKLVLENNKKEHASALALVDASVEKLKAEAYQAQQKADAKVTELNTEVAAKSAEVQALSGLVSSLKDAIQKLQMKADIQEKNAAQLSLEMQKMHEKQSKIASLLAVFEGSQSTGWETSFVQMIKQELKENNA